MRPGQVGLVYQLQFGGSLRKKPLCFEEKSREKLAAIRRSIWPKKFMHYAMSSLFQANFFFPSSFLLQWVANEIREPHQAINRRSSYGIRPGAAPLRKWLNGG